MAFGKKMTPELKEKLGEQHLNVHVARTGGKMLRVPPPGTPLGDQRLIEATEKQMTEELVCGSCGQKKNDQAIALTGACTECWEVQSVRDSIRPR